MLEIVRAIHQALHTESTWTFVLVIALVFGIIAGAAAWIIDRGYKNSVQESAREELSLTCDTVNLPLLYRGDMWSLDTAVFLKGLSKYSVNSLKPEWLWPEDGARGTGIRCVVKNYGTATAFGVAIPLSATKKEIIHDANGGWHGGGVAETHNPVIEVPQPLGPQDLFTFYICGYYPDRLIEVTIPTFAFVSRDGEKKARVELRVASVLGNPFNIVPYVKRSSR